MECVTGDGEKTSELGDISVNSDIASGEGVSNGNILEIQLDVAWSISCTGLNIDRYELAISFAVAVGVEEAPSVAAGVEVAAAASSCWLSIARMPLMSGRAAHPSLPIHMPKSSKPFEPSIPAMSKLAPKPEKQASAGVGGWKLSMGMPVPNMLSTSRGESYNVASFERGEKIEEKSRLRVVSSMMDAGDEDDEEDKERLSDGTGLDARPGSSSDAADAEDVAELVRGCVRFGKGLTCLWPSLGWYCSWCFLTGRPDITRMFAPLAV